jgi:hypothetical protein
MSENFKGTVFSKNKFNTTTKIVSSTSTLKQKFISTNHPTMQNDRAFKYRIKF